MTNSAAAKKQSAWRVTMRENTRGIVEIRQGGVLVGRGFLPFRGRGARSITVHISGGGYRRVVLRGALTLPTP